MRSDNNVRAILELSGGTHSGSNETTLSNQKHAWLPGPLCHESSVRPLPQDVSGHASPLRLLQPIDQNVRSNSFRWNVGHGTMSLFKTAWWELRGRPVKAQISKTNDITTTMKRAHTLNNARVLQSTSRRRSSAISSRGFTTAVAMRTRLGMSMLTLKVEGLESRSFVDRHHRQRHH